MVGEDGRLEWCEGVCRGGDEWGGGDVEAGGEGGDLETVWAVGEAETGGEVGGGGWLGCEWRECLK